jgi:hypothetical protein
MRWFFRALALVAIPCGIASFYNVYAEEPALEATAHKIACGARGPRCNARMTRQARMPWKRAYVFTAAADGRVQIDCKRAFVFVGDYTCARGPTVTY